ncbi:MAG TPA: DUF2339 domain-containing protein, partial [Pseudonocardia sp.]|nr:DUF2339 domain-containing protein [Pseudonocardia sp.]
PAPWWRRPALSGPRLLAWTGGAVTLLGVVLLMVLAASRGWFSPTARVLAGALLGCVLVGIAVRLHRRETARTGALALAATGVATLYLVVAAAATVVPLLPSPVAVALALLVAAGGLALADRWRSELLGAGAAAGAALLAVVLASGALLVALVLVLQVAAAPAVLRRRWARLAAVTAIGPLVYGSVLAATVGPEAGRVTALTAVVAAAAAVLGTAALGRTRLPVGPVAGLVVAAPVPVLIAAGVLGGWGGAGLAAGAAAVLCGIAALPRTEPVLGRAALTASAFALFQAVLLATDGSTRTAVLLGQAVVLAALAAALRRRLPLAVATAYGVLGTLLALTADAPLRALVLFPAEPYLVAGHGQAGALLAGLGVSALVLVLAVVATVAAGRVGLVRPDAASAALWAPAGAAGLYGAAGVIVTAALLVVPDRLGFVTGHAVVTVSWTVVALVLLARGISRPALRVTGLVLVAAAVAKLVLFDLVALDGLARVAAFLGAGLVLLAAGARYARMVAEAQPAQAGPVS